MKKNVIAPIAIVVVASLLACGFLCVKNTKTNKVPKIYFTRDISPNGLVKIYEKVNKDIKGKVLIKFHTGEPHGPNILPIDMVKALVDKVPNSTLGDTNTLYKGDRTTTEQHRKTIAINGWDKIAKVDILDEDGAVNFPVKGGKHFKEVSMGSHLQNYNSMIVLTHFKGHTMGGFGGSIKNIAIGCADGFKGHTMGGFGGSIKNIAIGCADGRIGKAQVHGADKKDPQDYGKWVPKAPFMENMVESAKATIDHFGKNITFINVLRRMSVDCDCAGVSAEEPKIKDIGILASTDILAVDQASIDLVYRAPKDELKDIKERIESREGLHQLEYGEEIGIGSRKYELVNID